MIFFFVVVDVNHATDSKAKTASRCKFSKFFWNFFRKLWYKR